MERRYSRSEKGKWQAPSELPTKKPPVRIPANDNEDLIEAIRLTIIGRLTNPQIKKPIRAVLDFMTQIWNLEGRVVGRALGLDKFQLKFKSEAELLQVLDNGPYHSKRWILIMQRWEPTVSDRFPSKISFNVRIHDIPLHYWHEGAILTIGKELGSCYVKDVKEAKIWVEVNGLKPLVMQMEIELPTEDNDVMEVEFEYIKIEKNCFTCFSLFHEEVDCPHRHPNALPPKERALGITQSIALQRIEAEKRRHDDRRGYSRPEDLRVSSRGYYGSYAQRGRNNTKDRNYHIQREDHHREQSILSRTARSSSHHPRSKAPSLQYRVVDKSRASAGSSAPLQNPVRQYEDSANRVVRYPQAEKDLPSENTQEVPSRRG